jgi:hypothetical protein
MRLIALSLFLYIAEIILQMSNAWVTVLHPCELFHTDFL